MALTAWLAVASVVIPLTGSPARPALPPATRRIVPTLPATWSAPTARPTAFPVSTAWATFAARTPPPQPTLTPTASAPAARRGPTALRLWNGQTVSVMPAETLWKAGRLQWQVPDAAAGWHSSSADCGAGVTVIGGHVSWGGVPGVFAALPTADLESRVVCIDAEGRERRFRPVDTLEADPLDDLREWTPEWSPALILYTCTPELNGKLVVVRFEEER